MISARKPQFCFYYLRPRLAKRLLPTEPRISRWIYPSNGIPLWEQSTMSIVLIRLTTMPVTQAGLAPMAYRRGYGICLAALGFTGRCAQTIRREQPTLTTAIGGLLRPAARTRSQSQISTTQVLGLCAGQLQIFAPAGQSSSLPSFRGRRLHLHRRW